MNHKFKIILFATLWLCLAAPATWSARLSITDLKAGLDAETTARQAADDAETVARQAVEVDTCVLYLTLNMQYSIGLTPPSYCSTEIYAVGDRGPAGGIVFRITSGGLHGLEAARVDQRNAKWGCNSMRISGADGTVIGTGVQNTADIVAGCADANTAAKVADAYEFNGFTDWFLPSKDELNELYLNKDDVGGFTGVNYWSSSEVVISTAWRQIFSNGDQYSYGKALVASVRAVRVF